jgi:outer membrane usher protein FimD/PapC
MTNQTIIATRKSSNNSNSEQTIVGYKFSNNNYYDKSVFFNNYYEVNKTYYSFNMFTNKKAELQVWEEKANPRNKWFQSLPDELESNNLLNLPDC